MRTLVALTAGVAVVLCAPPGAPARALETVSGQALDAGGRPLANVRVELVEDVRPRSLGPALRATVTGVQGAWAFGRVSPGRYVARVALGGHTAGVPVRVGPGPVDHVLIVAPSIASPSMQAAPIAGLGALGGGSTAAVVATVVAIGAGVATGVILGRMYQGRRGPFKDDQS